MIERLNYKRNKEISIPEGMLNGQGTGKLAELRYGFFSMSYNGCEIIAVSNLLTLIGKPKPICDIAREIYPYGNWFSGLFGTKTNAPEKYFKENKLPVHLLRKYTPFEKAFSASKCGIVVFWNDKNNAFKGIHTVCIENINNGIRVYNVSNNIKESVDFRCLNEYMKSKRFICGYYVN